MNKKIFVSFALLAFVSAGFSSVQAAVKGSGTQKKTVSAQVVRVSGEKSTLKRAASKTTQSKTVTKSAATGNTNKSMTVGAKRAAAAKAKSASSTGNTETGMTVGAKRAAKAKKAAMSEKATGTKDDEKPAASSGKSSAVTAKGYDIDVGLLIKQKEIQLSLLADVKAQTNGKDRETFKKGTTLTVTASGDTVSLNGKKFGSAVVLNPTSDAVSFRTKGNTYRGRMKLLASGGGVTCVNSLSMEEYLQGVVPCEVSPSWHRDAIRAQAVAARTYAVYHKNSYRSSGYDVTDDTYSQVYEGAGAEAAQTTQAVRDTAGMIITAGGKPIDAVFHANGGGYTENSENVWGSSVSYLRGVKEESSSVLDKAWTKKVSLDTFQKNLGIGKYKSLSLSKLERGKGNGKDRGVSGRVKTFTVKGDKKEVKTTGDKMQALYDLPSTLFDMKISGKEVIFTGYGSGHGLGLSQWGAQAMALKHGGSKDYYQKILMHYYTGTKITKVY